MSKRDIQLSIVAAVACCIIGSGSVFAQETRFSDQDLPKPVAELVQAMSSVEGIEANEDGTFIVHARIALTGSRILREVDIQIAENGEVMDWGDTPFMTRTYTREQLRQTGEPNLADMLSRLDPAIQSNSGG